jgi:stringent starvation protein B
MAHAMPEPSTKPYLIRAIHAWCTDAGYTPYIAVAVGPGVTVPAQHVKDGEIVLNLSALATNRLQIDNQAISFQARFGGVAREIRVPIDAVLAIYARENGQGMAFEPAPPAAGAGDDAAAQTAVFGDAAPPATEAVVALPPPRAPESPLRLASERSPTEQPPADAGPDDPVPPPDRPRLKRVK